MRRTLSGNRLINSSSIKSEIDANVRRESDLAGMNAVMEYEMKRATTDEQKQKIIDISERDTGYDVESFDRCIEVKSFKKSGPAKLTSHEWGTAERMGDEYWLYVVENAQTEPKITEIQNPFKKFKDTVKTEESIEYRYVIENWKNNTVWYK